MLNSLTMTDGILILARFEILIKNKLNFIWQKEKN